MSYFNSFNLNLIAGTCFETGNYDGNYIDAVGNINDAEKKCQKLCQEHSQCKFWTYNSSSKICWRQTENAPMALGTCTTCIHGPSICSGKHLTDSIATFIFI